MSKLVQLLNSSFEIKLEAAYCLCHVATHQQKAWAEAMLEEKALEGFVPLLKSHNGEEIHIALTYFEAMFRLLVGIIEYGIFVVIMYIIQYIQCILYNIQ